MNTDSDSKQSICAILCIIVLCIIVYFGVLDTNKFIIGITLTIFVFLVVTALALLTLNFKLSKQALENEKIKIDQETKGVSDERGEILPLLKQSKSSNTIQNQQESPKTIKNDFKKLDHYYISIY